MGTELIKEEPYRRRVTGRAELHPLWPGQQMPPGAESRLPAPPARQFVTKPDIVRTYNRLR